MKKIMMISVKDNTFYNFRREKIIKFIQLGHEVVLVCPYGEKIDYFTERGCRFIDLDLDRRGTNIFKDFKLMAEYYKLIRKEKPDVVLTYTSKPSVYAGFVCGVTGVPYIVNNAGLMETTGLFDIFMKFLYAVGFRKASCIMFQNDLEKETILSVLPKKIRSRRLPGSGVNLEEFPFCKYPENDDIITFNFVARIVKIKGIDEFLECANRIKAIYPKTEFVIYGDYDDDSYKNKIKELEKTGIIRYGGVQLDMEPAIKAAHAVIHPSYYEGMTNVVLEHSAMGRVCIGADIPGIRDGIEDGRTGYLFKVKNVDSLVEAVEKFINLPYEEKAEMGRLAREKMECEFDRKIVTDIYLEEIERILK